MSKDSIQKLKRLCALWDWIDNSESKIYARPEEGGLFTLEEWAKKFATSRRTIMRDLALIKEMGINFSYIKGPRSSLLSSEFDFSLNQLHLTPQMAAVLCLAYEEAKRAGHSFTNACQEIKNKFIPQIEHCEINPPLPESGITKTLRTAIQKRYYVNITTSQGTEKIIKPFCFIRIAKKKTELIYLDKRNLPISAPIEKMDDFFAISLTSIKDAFLSRSNNKSRSMHFPLVKHQKWAAFAFIRFHTECFLEKADKRSSNTK